MESKKPVEAEDPKLGQEPEAGSTPTHWVPRVAQQPQPIIIVFEDGRFEIRPGLRQGALRGILASLQQFADGQPICGGS